MATVFRPPLYTPRGSSSVSRVPQSAQSDVTSNRCLLFGKDQFFAAPGQAPTYDWPNPLSRWTRFPQDDLTEADGSEFWLLKDRFFGGAGQPPWPVDQPNPRGYLYPVSLRTWTQDLYRLAGKDQFFGAAGQAIDYDWPNPLIARRATELLTHVRSGLALTAVIIARPFSQTDWPNPQPTRLALENKTQVDPSEFWLLKDTFFGGPGQPPSPTPATSLRLAPFPVDLRTWSQNHLLDTLAPVTATPFVVIDWPNPQTRAFPPEDRTQADPSEFWLLKDQFFGAAGQPPSPTPAAPYVPRTHPIDLRTWTQNRLLDTLFPTARPFVQTDWPVPRGPRAVISLRTLTEFTRLLGKDRIFGSAGQPITIWPQPNPLGPRYPSDLRTQMLGLSSWYSILSSLGEVHCAEVTDLNPALIASSLNPERTVILVAVGVSNALFDPAVFDPALFEAMTVGNRLTVLRLPPC